MRKHEALYTIYGPPGRPYVHRDYPMMMYRFLRAKDGTPVAEGEVAPGVDERRNLESRGFVAGGQGKAWEAFEAQELEHAKLAAEINYDAKHKLSEQASAEVQTAQETFGAQHLPEVPRTPVKKLGWPKGKPRGKKAVETAVE